MGMLPDVLPKRSWGAATIFKESARLLHRHARLFLPFYLAFCVPASILSVFQSAFLGPGSHITHHHFTQAGTDTTASGQFLPSLVYSILARVLSALATAAFTYIVAYIYTESDADTTSKIFKLLPRALLRVFVTSFWVFLAVCLLSTASLIVGAALYLLVSSLPGYLAIFPLLIGVLVVLPYLSCVVSISIMFAFGQFVAVLEPGSYGREALKKSTILVRAGGVGTLLAIFGVNVAAIGVLLLLPTQAIAAGTLPLWAAVVLAVAIVALESVIVVYFGVVPIVTFFVYKSRFNAVCLRIPEFQGAGGTSAGNVYEPLVLGSDHPRSMAEA